MSVPVLLCLWHGWVETLPLFHLLAIQLQCFGVFALKLRYWYRKKLRSLIDEGVDIFSPYKKKWSIRFLRAGYLTTDVNYARVCVEGGGMSRPLNADMREREREHTEHSNNIANWFHIIHRQLYCQ